MQFLCFLLIAPTIREVRSQLVLGLVQLVSDLLQLLLLRSSSSFGGVWDSLLELGLVHIGKGLLQLLHLLQ